MDSYICDTLLVPSGSTSRKQRLTALGTCCADHVTPLYPQKLALTSLTGGGRSVGIVRSRTKATEFIYIYMQLLWQVWCARSLNTLQAYPRIQPLKSATTFETACTAEARPRLTFSVVFLVSSIRFTNKFLRESVHLVGITHRRKPCLLMFVDPCVIVQFIQKKSNNMQQCIKILLFHIYMKLNMFRATHFPSSGA